MCVTCVATGSAYVVPALVGLRVHAGRRRRRRLGDPGRVPTTPAAPSTSPPTT